MKNSIFTPEALAKFRQLVENAVNIVITNHKNPDGDAMGSALALSHIMTNWGHPATIVVPNEYPKFLKWMPGDSEVVVFEGHQEEAKKKIESADLIFALDYNDLSRTGEMEQPLTEAKAQKVLIDHHQNPSDFADISLSDVSSCATTQLIYELFESLDMLDLINKDAATCIYTGLVTDTGSFRYPSTSNKTHQIAAHLLQIGVENGIIHRNLFDNKTEIVLKMRGHVLSNNLVVLKEFNTAYITMSRKEQEQYDTKSGDTEGLVNEALSIEGVVMAAFFKEDYNLIKISFRSAGNVPVNELSSQYFGGGGHRNAAGGSSKESLEETVERFLDILPKFKNQLHASE